MTAAEAEIQPQEGRHDYPTFDASTARLTPLVQQYLPFVYRVLRHLGLGEGDADDGTQQVFLVLARRLADVPPGRERAFLSATATRIADRVRRGHRRRREEMEDPAVLELPSSAPAPDQRLEQAEAQRLLLAVLERMPTDLREALVLFELEELTMREIAQALELPQGTVASRIRRARLCFQKLVEELHHSPSYVGGWP